MVLDQKQKLVRYSTYLAVAVASILVVSKLAAWIATDSVSVLSSLVDSILDLLGSTCTLLAIRYAFTPADKEHRFGHGKAEGLIALAQSAFITGSALFVLIEASSHTVSTRGLVNEGYGIVVMLLSIFLTAGLLVFQRYVVAKTESVAISADALHYKGDLLMNLAVLVALLSSYFFEVRSLDVILGTLIALYLLYNAWQIITQSLDSLMDKELPDDERALIEAIAKRHGRVLDVHDLRTRRSGLITFIQLHIEMEGDMSLNEAHVIAEAVEAELLKTYPDADIIIHQDPHGIEEERQDDKL